MDPRGTPVALQQRTSPVSRSYAYRKVTKPLLERRRRARISKCLDELKALLVGPMRIPEESMNRLEKADILEMAVQHLHNLKNTHSPNRYQEGFNECAAEACHFLEVSPDYDENVSERLVEHLETCTGPLTIEVPRYRLTFSPPVSPASLGTSIQSFNHQTCLQDLVQSQGLLMTTKKCDSQNQQASRIKYAAKCRPTYSSLATPPLSRERNLKRSPLSECQTPMSDESMWRPW